MKIALFGGTGLIGTELVNCLNEKHRFILFTRNKTGIKDKLDNCEVIEISDNENNLIASLEDCDAIINLAGESIASGRWTKKKKEAILNSRINTTKFVFNLIEKTKNKPKVYIAASAVGYYGNRYNEELNEVSSSGKDFLSNVTIQLENEVRHFEKLGVRTILLRIGIVLSNKGGALPKILLPIKLFIGGKLGAGNQWMPWIHINDLTRIIEFCVINPINGPVNAVSPNPVTNKEFTFAAAKLLKRPSFLSVPSFVLKFSLGEMSSILLGGQKAIPQKLNKANFCFHYSSIHKALSDLLI